jgi:serine/threonine protein kinase
MPSPTNIALPPELARTIDPVCDAFEAAWRQGQRPVIEDHLGRTAEAVRPLLLEELVRTELEWRCLLGEQLADDEYARRFPACAARIPGWLAEARAAAEQLRASGPAGTDHPGSSSTGLSSTGTFDPRGVPDVEEPVPKVLGEYELLEPLGAGGMGKVYKARHRKLDKLVALKLLRGLAQPSPEALARFLREMRAAGGLDHPNVVEAHDAGEQAGVAYLVMKLVEGTDLARLVRERGPLPVAEACELARQAALGLQHLHERGLVHRDVKPSNLMRTPDGVVKILDLGLARWREEVAPGDDLTGAGRFLGTPNYLAPEQARSAAEVDIRADVYGLGSTLFYLLTGRAPFAHHEDGHQKLKAHQGEAPPTVRVLRPEVPAGLADLVGRLLAKRPEDRPQTPGEVATVLSKLARGHGPATRDGRSRRAWHPLPRRPWLAAGVFGLMAMFGLGMLLLGHSRPGQGPPRVADESPPARREGEVIMMPGGMPKGTPTHVKKAVEGKVQHSPQQAPAKVQLLRLDVKHFANVNGQFDQPRGVLGKDSFATRQGDSVTVEACLSQPAYAYLLAFRPDGIVEVCFPESKDEPPPLTDRPRYPTAESRGVNYGLDEGTGLQVFALIVSRRPLPSFKEWRARQGAIPWKQSPAPPGVVWRDDGTDIVARTMEDPTGQRAKGREVSGKTTVVKLTDWLRQALQVEAVAAVGFAVLPKDKP